MAICFRGGSRSCKARWESALGGISAALEYGEGWVAANESQAHGIGVGAHAGVIGFAVPDFGLGEAEAAQQQPGVDEGGDEEGLFDRGRLPVEEILAGEGTEFDGSSSAMTWVLAYRPVLRELALEAALPSAERGPEEC